MADGDLVFEDGRMSVRTDVNDGHVLNVGPRADADEIDVSTYDGAEPYARIFADLDIADDHGTFGDKDGRMDPWLNTLVLADHLANLRLRAPNACSSSFMRK